MITAVVLVGEGGADTEPVAWVQDARRAAAMDLVEQLAGHSPVREIVVVSPHFEPPPVATPVRFILSRPGPIHVGRTLTDIVEQTGARRLLYFGGGSAPLLGDEILSDIIAALSTADQAIFTNNRFASDWAGITPASILAYWQERLPQDNMLGWVLSTEAGLPVHTLPSGAASRLDIDTPAELLTLRLHGGTRPHLRRYLETLPLDTGRLQAVISVLATPASQVFMAGRVGPEAWAAINRATHCWIRLLAEERGMVSSGRQARGEAYSLLADHIENVGLDRFFEGLARQAQAALIDSRVLLAHHKRWPPASDRFASDLGLVAQVQDPWLRAFTEAVLAAPIPIILGGHGLLAGDLFALAEMV